MTAEPGRVERRLQSLQETVSQLKQRLQEVQREPEGLQSCRSAPSEPSPKDSQVIRRLEGQVETLRRELKLLKQDKSDLEKDLGRLRGMERELLRTKRENEELKEIKARFESEVQRLMQENDDLQLQLQQQSIDRADDTELHLKARISELEQELAAAQTGSETVRTLQSSLLEKQLVIEGLRKPAGSSLERVAERLGVGEQEVEAAVEEMMRELQYRRTAAVTIERIGQLMVDCAMSSDRPSVKQVWRWVRQLTEEFMNVTQHYRNLSAMLTELCEFLGVQSPKDLKPRIAALVGRPDFSDFLVSADD